MIAITHCIIDPFAIDSFEKKKNINTSIEFGREILLDPLNDINMFTYLNKVRFTLSGGNNDFIFLRVEYKNLFLNSSENVVSYLAGLAVTSKDVDFFSYFSVAFGCFKFVKSKYKYLINIGISVDKVYRKQKSWYLRKINTIIHCNDNEFKHIISKIFINAEVFNTIFISQNIDVDYSVFLGNKFLILAKKVYETPSTLGRGYVDILMPFTGGSVNLIFIINKDMFMFCGSQIEVFSCRTLFLEDNKKHMNSICVSISGSFGFEFFV